MNTGYLVQSIGDNLVAWVAHKAIDCNISNGLPKNTAAVVAREEVLDLMTPFQVLHRV